MTHITLRKVPDKLAERLRLHAKEHHQSMNSAAIALLSEQLGLAPKKRHKRRDLSRFAGVWSSKEAKEFADNTAMFEEIDEELWS